VSTSFAEKSFDLLA